LSKTQVFILQGKPGRCPRRRGTQSREEGGKKVDLEATEGKALVEKGNPEEEQVWQQGGGRTPHCGLSLTDV
jgi:hypothetical protein